MAANSSVTITASVAGGPSGTRTTPLGGLVISNATSTDQISVLALSSGFNSVTVPTNAVGVIIIPPAGNSQSITLKGVTGDTGLSLHLTNPTILSLAAAQTTIGLTLGGAITIEFFWF